ncbi:MAG: flagellar protein FliT [Firmicutes bacterium]|nr:flagellar protein FliT [Bacillota bacterium]
MTTDQNAVLVSNLEKQKALYTKMLDVSCRQLTLMQSTRGDIDVESLNNMLAERQNLMERIDCLKQALPARSVASELDRMKALFKEILNIMREIDQHDQASREIVQGELVVIKDCLKKARTNRKANSAYVGYQTQFEGNFFDQRK